MNILIKKQCLNKRLIRIIKTSIIHKNFSQRIILKNGTIVNADQTFVGDVYISNGKIDEVINKDSNSSNTSNDFNSQNAKIINCANKFIIPGGIDTHTHMQLPFMGTVAVDDFNFGSRAALAGGTTSFIDFIIPEKDESLLIAHDKWRSWADGKVNCDYSLHCAVTSWSKNTAKEMEEIVKRGITSFKVFLAYKGALMLDDGEFYKVLEKCKELGAVCMVHAENGEMLSLAQQKIRDLGITGPEGHYLSRPESFEAEATHKAIMIADYVTSPIYVVHVQNKLSADEVAKAKRNGSIVYGETLAASLGTDGRNLWNKNWTIAAGHVMSPPLNPDPTVKEYLMKQLGSGMLSTVATDNCTFCNSQKRIGEKDFSLIPNGVNGVEDRLSIVWTNGVKKGILSPSDFVRITSSEAAKIFNMYPRKGLIAKGADADLVVWDGEKERVISRKTHHQKVDFNVFEGMKVKGTADITFSNGKIVYQQGKLNTDHSGRFISRKPFGYAFERFNELNKHRDPRNFKVERNQKDMTDDVGDWKAGNFNQNAEEEILELKKRIIELENLNKNLQNNNNQSHCNSGETKKPCTSTSHNENEYISNVEDFLKERMSEKDFNKVRTIMYGEEPKKLEISERALKIAEEHDFEIRAYKHTLAEPEQLRQPRLVRIAGIQNKMVLPTTAPFQDQIKAIHERIEKILTAAYHSGVNIVCLQETWVNPFFLCTRERTWNEFAESARHGPTTKFLSRLAQKFNMVIVSPILERDDVKDTVWNTAVVIDNRGDVIGKHRKTHIPRVGDFNESTYYFEGDTGCPVFETDFGRIGVNICYGRHFPLHWMAFACNQADVVFNPSATVGHLSEPLWGVEARNAAIANHYITLGINRVGTERFENPFTSGDGKPSKHEFGPFYGSSYVSFPDGTRTPGLSRDRDGLLVTEVDLNINRQTKDKWKFAMAGRFDLYAELLKEYVKKDFKPQIIKKGDETKDMKKL